METLYHLQFPSLVTVLWWDFFGDSFSQKNTNILTHRLIYNWKAQYLYWPFLDITINNILRPITFGWKYCKRNLILEDMSHLTLVTPNNAKNNIPYKLVRRICTIVENSDVRKKHLEESRKLYVLVMSRTRFRVNSHSIVALMSRNSLLKAGAKSEVKLTCQFGQIMAYSFTN